MRFTDRQRTQLLDLARRSIAHGLAHDRPLQPDPADYDAVLNEPGASFVTLRQHGDLRGCIGSLEARRPLIVDIATNAHAAAFRDPRFPRLQSTELDGVSIHISVLGQAEPLAADSEREVLQQLRAGIDGLVIEEGPRRGTFLPSVWETLPEPAIFLRQLKLKAGLPPDYWSNSLRISRYTTESFGDDDRLAVTGC